MLGSVKCATIQEQRLAIISESLPLTISVLRGRNIKTCDSAVPIKKA